MPSPLTETTTFTESSQALTAIVDQFRNQTLPLEEALALFEKGIGYVRSCQSTLGNAKGKLQTLSQALAEARTTGTLPIAEEFTANLSAEQSASAPNNLTDYYTWQHQEALTNTNIVLDEAWLKQLLLTLKANLPFQTQGLPKLYERENQSGLEAFLPLANGWLMVSVWSPKSTKQGTIKLQLQIAENASLIAQDFDASSLFTALTKAIN